MPIVFVEETKKQQKLIFVFVIAVLAVAFVIWRGFFAPERPSSTITISSPASKIEINLKDLQSLFLEELQPFERIRPIEKGTKVGRANPFIRY